MTNETEKYTKKEEAKSNLEAALKEYIKAAEGFEMDDVDMVIEVEGVVANCGKSWGIIA